MPLALAASIAAAVGVLANGLTVHLGIKGVNFQGRMIPKSFGLGFAFAFLVFGRLTGSCHAHPGDYSEGVVATFALLGFLDDVGGDRSVGGLKGHLGALLRGKPTTGALKAVGGTAAAILIGWRLHHAWPLALLAAVLISGTANTLNLVDLRPGRCLAVFFAGCAMLIPAMGGWMGAEATRDTQLLAFGLLCGLVLFAGERRALYMLGDTGSNAFGALLGLSFALALPVSAQIALAAGILLLHAWTEKHSISKAIEANPALRRLDAIIGVR